MTIAQEEQMHLTYNNTVGGYQQLVYPNPNTTNLVAITITVDGQTVGTNCKIWIENIHGGTTASPNGYAELQNLMALTFTVEPGGIGEVWIEEGATNSEDFEVRWFPSFIGRTYGNKADPYSQMSGVTRNFRGV